VERYFDYVLSWAFIGVLGTLEGLNCGQIVVEWYGSCIDHGSEPEGAPQTSMNSNGQQSKLK
jgi:hypothetical protein